MFLRKAQAGSAPDVTWHNDGDIREVSDCLGRELLAIPEGGFSEVMGPDPDPEPESPQEPVGSDEEPAKKKGGRPALPRDENGNIIRKTEIAE